MNSFLLLVICLLTHHSFAQTFRYHNASNFPTNKRNTQNFHPTLKLVHEAAQFGFNDQNNKELVSPIYADIGVFREGVVPVSKEGKYGYLNEQGEVVIPLIYDFAWGFENGLAAVQKGDL